MRDLYGMKSDSADLCNNISDCMTHLGHTMCITYPELWMKHTNKPDDKISYYAYLFCYIYNIKLIIDNDAHSALHQLNK